MPDFTGPSAKDPLLRRGPAFAVLWQGLPLALGLASHALINLVDLAMVGRLGDEAVQAAHVATTWNFLPMIVGNCVSTALLARLSRRLGAGDVAGARQLHLRAQWFMLWLSLVTALVTAVPAVPQIDATGLVGATHGDAVHYLVVSNLGCVPMFVLMQTTAAMRAAGEVLVPIALLVLANVINLLLNLVLLFGWDALSVPSIGVAGAAYASVLARSVAAVMACWWLRRPGHLLSLRAVAATRLAVAKDLLGDAWPQVVQIALRAGLVILLTVVVQRRFGDVATVGLGIATRLDTLILFASLGFANAATAYAGRAVVVGWPARARAAGLWAAVQAGLLGTTLLLFLQAWSVSFVGWFLAVPTPAVVQATAVYLGLAGWAQVLGAVALGAIGAVQGAGRMVAPLLVDLPGFLLTAILLARSLLGEGPIEEAYGALVFGMSIVALSQLLFVGWGAWVRRPVLSQ